MVELKMNSNRTAFSVLGRFLFLLSMPDLIRSLSYPIFMTKRFGRVPVNIRMPMLDPFVQRYADYSAPDYEDVYAAPPRQEEDEYSAYVKYPFVPLHGYYSNVDRENEKESDSYGYLDDQMLSDPMVDLQTEMVYEDRSKESGYPYGRETWFEGANSNFDSNVEANVAFLQNLILAQMLQDAAANSVTNSENLSKYSAAAPFIYTPNKISSHPLPTLQVHDDEVDDRQWFYGIPTSAMDEENSYKTDVDDSVKELESLKEPLKLPRQEILKTPKGKASKKIKVTSNNRIPKDEILLQLQSQINRNSRKNPVSVADGLQLGKKQSLSLEKANFDKKFSKYLNIMEKKAEKLAAGEDIRESLYNAGRQRAKGTATVKPPTKKATESSASHGQKEYVLPRPANPVHGSYSISTRSDDHISVYDAIKNLLNKEEALQQKKTLHLQKRFVLDPDQLSSELSGLKKTST